MDPEARQTETRNPEGEAQYQKRWLSWLGVKLTRDGDVKTRKAMEPGKKKSIQSKELQKMASREYECRMSKESL